MKQVTTERGDRLTAADFEPACKPIGEARGLPNACYTDPSHFALETRQLFDRTWVCIGFGKDIPEPGDALPIDHLGTPLLALRGKDGRVSVFHNVCSHRGMVLVEEPTRIRSVIRCPYHSWCYNLDGSLKAFDTPCGRCRSHTRITALSTADFTRPVRPVRIACLDGSSSSSTCRAIKPRSSTDLDSSRWLERWSEFDGKQVFITAVDEDPA